MMTLLYTPSTTDPNAAMPETMSGHTQAVAWGKCMACQSRNQIQVDNGTFQSLYSGGNPATGRMGIWVSWGSFNQSSDD